MLVTKLLGSKFVQFTHIHTHSSDGIGPSILFYNLLMWETWVRSLCWEDPLEKGKATHPVFWPGEFQYSGLGRKESDTTE